MKGSHKEAERLRRIFSVMETLKQIESQEVELSLEKFVMEICLRYGVTERRAKEYIKLAQFKLDGTR